MKKNSRSVRTRSVVCVILFTLWTGFRTWASTAPTFEWVQTAFTSLYEYGGDVGVDGQGRVIWTFVEGSSSGNSTSVLSHYSSEGIRLVVNRSIGFGSGFGTVASAVDASGGVTALTSYRTGSSSDIFWAEWFRSYRASGVLAWGYNGSSLNWIADWTAPTAEPCQPRAAAGPGGTNVFVFPFARYWLTGQTYDAGGPELAIAMIAPTGTPVWVKRVIGTGFNIPAGVVMDPAGNVYVAGYNYGGAAFDTLNLPARGGRDGFLAKYDPAGNVVWVTGPVSSGDDTITSLALGADGRLWMTGTSASTLSLGGLTLTGSSNYLASCSLNGVFMSAVRLPTGVSVSALKPYPDGSLILSGAITAASFGSVPVTNHGGRDILVACVATSGQPAWAKAIGYVYDDTPCGLAVTSSGEIYVTGTVLGGAVFDAQFVAGSGNEDAFLAKLSAANAPELTDWPRSTNVFRGVPVTFSCAVATGPAATFQWFFNGVAIPLATNSSYTLPSVNTALQGYYYVEVRNEAGTVRSPSALLGLRGKLPVLVTTIAGTNVAGYVDANRGSDARFNQPNGIAHWNGGLVAVSDAWNHAVRLLDPGGAVGTFAGRGTAGYSNGVATVALFVCPLGLAVDSTTDILVADTSNNVIRRVSASGLRNVTTVAGSGIAGYVDGAQAQARFDYPNDLATDARGNIYVSEWQNHTIRRITPEGVVSTLAGNGTPGFQDGAGGAARFNQPGGIAIDPKGNLYVTEWTGHRVRRVATSGQVTTIAGNGTPGFVDGVGVAARFNQPDGIAIDPLGNLYVSEAGNHAIRKIDPTGLVTTVAGLGTPGMSDGDADAALFRSPGGVAWHPAGTLLVADTGNHSIRQIGFVADPTYPEAAALVITLNPALTIFGKVGNTYRIDSAESRSGPLEWTALDTVTLTNATLMWCDPQPATRVQRLYRAVKVN